MNQNKKHHSLTIEGSAIKMGTVLLQNLYWRPFTGTNVFLLWTVDWYSICILMYLY